VRPQKTFSPEQQKHGENKFSEIGTLCAIETPDRVNDNPNPRKVTMTDAQKLAAVKKAAAQLVNAILRDEGGFCVETLHAMNSLSEVAGLPDYTGVTASDDWQISGEGDDNVRFFGEAVHAESN